MVKIKEIIGKKQIFDGCDGKEVKELGYEFGRRTTARLATCYSTRIINIVCSGFFFTFFNQK